MTSDGYCAQLDPYQGAGNNRGQELGLGGSVVMKLLQNLPQLSYHVYADNFFTSLDLIDALTVKGIAFTGTTRANRTHQAPLQNRKK